MAQRPRSYRDRLGKALCIFSPKVAEGPASPVAKPPPKRIKEIVKFDKLYSIGREVMPCGHRHMMVNFGTRRSDGMECVIKRRFKPHCFSCKADEMTWRRSTEYVLNMPDSEHVAKVYEVLEDSSAFYIVMERVNGMDLFETVSQKRVTVEEAREIIQQLLRAMEHLHTNSAVHKDIKLENVMIDTCEMSPRSASGESMNFCGVKSQSSFCSESSQSPKSVKVIDFDTVDEWTPTSPLPRDVLGTDQYIAPESYAGKYSPMSDIFAVGVIAYKLLCNKFPFNAKLFDDKPGENWVGSPKMQEIRERLKVAKVDFSHDVFSQNPLATDLVKSMLSSTQALRPSAASALKHLWFRETENDFAKIASTRVKGSASSSCSEATKPATDHHLPSLLSPASASSSSMQKKPFARAATLPYMSC